MSVTVDCKSFAIEPLGLETVGELLSHLKKKNRLVVQVLIDGQEPDLHQLPTVRQSHLRNHIVFVQTTEPARMALDALAEIQSQLDEADRLKCDAVAELQRNSTVKAMEKLSGCFSTWQHAQQSFCGVSQLLGIDPGQVRVGDHSVEQLMVDFSGRLRQIKTALEARDFVLLSELLRYGMSQAAEQWHGAIGALRNVVDSAE